jgi:oligosaccharyltransferase complex subunit delta (ribophorin II)
MRFLRSLLPSILLLGAGVAEAASSWSFEEATIAVNSKAGDGFKDKYVSTELKNPQPFQDMD